MTDMSSLRLERVDGMGLVGTCADGFGLVNEYLAHLLDRTTSLATVRSYGYDLLAFCRWLAERDVDLEQVSTEDLLGFLRACREARVPGRPGPNVVGMDGQRLDRYAATTINRRLAAISGLFAYAGLRDPRRRNPVPKGREARWRVAVNGRGTPRIRLGPCPGSAVGAAPARAAAPADGVVAC
jgi:integrase